MRVYLLLLVFCLTIFLGHYFLVGQAVYGDGIGYFAHLHSWVIDHDWDYTNEYKHNYNPTNNNAVNPSVSDSIQIVAITKDGKAENHYGPGMAILLLPFYVLANLTKPGNGFNDIYQIFTGIGAIVYSTLGVYLLAKLVNNKWAAMTIFLGTQLLYYGSFDVLNSHFGSFFLTCLFLLVLWGKKNSRLSNFALGSIAGLLFSTRLQDGLIIVLWILENVKQKQLTWPNILIFLAGFGILSIPMLYQWHILFGNIWQHTYFRGMNSGTNNFSLSHFGQSWFAPQGSLFSKAPILLMLLILFLMKLKKITNYKIWYLFIFFALQSVVISFQAGWSAAAYGGRMYISSLPFFAFLLDIFLRKVKYAKFYCLVFIAISFISFAHFVLFEKSTQGQKRGTEIMTQVRLERFFKAKF